VVDGHPDRGVEADLSTPDHYRVRDHLADTHRQIMDLGRVSVDQQHGNRVPAHAGDQVAGRQHRADAPRQFDHRPVRRTGM
jgi:hypothetical protein